MGVVIKPVVPSSTARPVPDRRTRVHRDVITACGLAAALGAGALIATSGHLARPAGLTVEVVLVISAAVAAALIWLERRPGNRIAWLLLGFAGTTAGIALQGASSDVLYGLGVAFDPLIFLATWVVVFAFPDGRLAGRTERVILAGFTSYLLLRFVPYLLFSPDAAGAGPLNACAPSCPPNGLAVADRPDLIVPIDGPMAWALVALLSATAGTLVFRLVTASRPRRRTLLPVYVPALVLTVALLAFHGVIAGALDLDPRTVSAATWAVPVGRVLMVVGFLLAIAQASWFAGAALRRLVVQIGDDPEPSGLRAIVSEALDDPSVELAFRDDRGAGYVTSRGEPVAGPAEPADGRAATPVQRRGETVAVIWHDPVLATDPELLRAVTRALVLALDSGQAGRRQLERDLHDGAQQHLVALRIKVELARERAQADPEMARRLTDVGSGLEDVLRELRDLARGIQPTVLRDLGLGQALAAAARRSATPVALDTRGIGRYPDGVETAVYFCCLEGLQNVSKHAGGDAHASIVLRDDGDVLRFEIVDDGAGCELGDFGAAGAGLTNMVDRVAAVGGALSVASVPGEGTQVLGRIPLPVHAGPARR